MTPPVSVSVKTGTPRPAVKHKKRGFHSLSVRVTDWCTVFPWENGFFTLNALEFTRAKKILSAFNCPIFLI